MLSQLRGEAAFSCACRCYMDTVFRVAAHNAPTEADAEDVTQEVFEALFTSGKSFRDAEHLKAWLIRVALNRCKNLHRARRWETGELPQGLSVPPPQPSSVLDEVRALPEHYRSAIYLHYYEGYTAAEIGKITGRSVGTVLSWLSRGRDALRKRMIGGFDDE